MLHFGAVDYAAEVWANGAVVARHQGGNTPFNADITDQLASDGSVSIVVRAEDSPTDPAQPRGKQDWQLKPHGIWYHRTTGIWQPVWIETVSAIHIDRVHTRPDIANARVHADIRLSDHSRGHNVRVVLSKDEQILAALTSPVMGRSTDVTLHIAALEHGMARAELLWTPDTPNLIDVTCEVIDAEGKLIDVVSSYLGLRSCGTAEGMFTLNDMPVFVRSVLSQGYWPESHLAAPSPDAIRAEVEAIKSLGFNAVRIHQKVEDPRFLYWCDRLGLMVWGEMANAYAFSPDAVDAFTREWLEVLDRDRSHPCIVTWVPLNESWGVPQVSQRPDQRSYADALYHLTHAIDSTRPVISNDGWEHTTSDIAGLHDYSVDPEDLRSRYRSRSKLVEDTASFGPLGRRLGLSAEQLAMQPVMVTEFGGLSFRPKDGDAWFGYQATETAEDYEKLLGDLFSALYESPFLCGYCYTQLTDTMQETNGLLDAARKPKLDPARIWAIVTAPVRSIPAEKLDLARNQAQGQT